MPFRRKHRSSVFGSSRSVDKENAGSDGMQDPMLPQPPLSPRLFRCHSDNSQRTCIDINPNALSSMNNRIMHRNSVLSTKEKMANLLELNSTLVKEVSFLRNSQHAISSDMKALKGELQATSSAAHKLRTENQELIQEVNKLKFTHSELKETLETEKSDAEGRLECVSLVVDNLQSMNGVLAEEAARLREDADRYATERHALLADLDRMLEEKSFLEGFVESVRASEEEFRKEMQQALLQAEREKKTIFDQKQALLEENNELQIASEELTKEVKQLEAENMALNQERNILLQEKQSLTVELSASTEKLHALNEKLASERTAMASLQSSASEEKMQMQAEKEELELCHLQLREDHRKVTQEFQADRCAYEKETAELVLRNQMLSDEKGELKQKIDSAKVEIYNLQQELVSVRALAMEAEIQAKASLDHMEMEKLDAISTLERDAKDAARRSADRERELVSLTKSLECKLEGADKALCEEKSLVQSMNDEVTSYKEKLDKASNEVSALAGNVAAEKEKQRRLEVHIQAMKGDLLVAEDAAIEAQKKVKAVEKEAGIAMEKRSREASQKIGALESKLAAMAERQCDLENHIRFKENAIKTAVQAENAAKGKLKELLDVMQSKGKSIEGHFEALKASMLELQKNASQGIDSITCLQEEFGLLKDVQANVSTASIGKKRRGRSRAKTYQAEQNNFH